MIALRQDHFPAIYRIGLVGLTSILFYSHAVAFSPIALAARTCNHYGVYPAEPTPGPAVSPARESRTSGLHASFLEDDDIVLTPEEKRMLMERETRPVMNRQIKADEVRVIVPLGNGKMEPLGVMTLNDALEKAQQEGADLILMEGKAVPPLCMLVEYTKYLYMKKKEAKETRKQNKTQKEVKLTLNLGQHDFDVRLKNTLKFLKNGHPVKVSVIMRGRNAARPERAFSLMERFQEALGKAARKATPKQTGNNVIVILRASPTTEGSDNSGASPSPATASNNGKSAQDDNEDDNTVA